MTNKTEIKPYLNEKDVFAQDEHINIPLVENLGLDPISTEEQIIEAINERLASVGINGEKLVYVADLNNLADTFGENKDVVLKFWDQD